MAAVRKKACIRVMCCMPPSWTTRSTRATTQVKWHDSMVHDHPIPGKRCEVLDIVGPPVSYMEKLRMFKPAEFVHNPKGLCRFYHMSPGKSNVLVGPRSAESACQLHHLLQIAQGLGRQLTVVVLEGESVTPKCLLSELHSRMALTRYVLHTSGKAKMGIWHHIFFCPICTYGRKQPHHISRSHRGWPLLGKFLLRCVSSFRHTHCSAEMKAHLLGCGQYGMERSKAQSPCKKAPQGSKSGCKSKGKKSKEGDSMKGNK